MRRRWRALVLAGVVAARAVGAGRRDRASARELHRQPLRRHRASPRTRCGSTTSIDMAEIPTVQVPSGDRHRRRRDGHRRRTRRLGDAHGAHAPREPDPVGRRPAGPARRRLVVDAVPTGPGRARRSCGSRRRSRAPSRPPASSRSPTPTTPTGSAGARSRRPAPTGRRSTGSTSRPRASATRCSRTRRTCCRARSTSRGDPVVPSGDERARRRIEPRRPSSGARPGVDRRRLRRSRRPDQGRSCWWRCSLAVGVRRAGTPCCPGHGKTLMAAYMVGAGGRVRQAVAVGSAVAVMHTASVLALGLRGAHARPRSSRPNALYPWLGLAVRPGRVRSGRLPADRPARRPGAAAGATAEHTNTRTNEDRHDQTTGTLTRTRSRAGRSRGRA